MKPETLSKMPMTGLRDDPTNRIMVVLRKDGALAYVTQCVPPEKELRETLRAKVEGSEVLWVSMAELRALNRYPRAGEGVIRRHAEDLARLGQLKPPPEVSKTKKRWWPW